MWAEADDDYLVIPRKFLGDGGNTPVGRVSRG